MCILCDYSKERGGGVEANLCLLIFSPVKFSRDARTRLTTRASSPLIDVLLFSNGNNRSYVGILLFTLSASGL